MKTSRCSRNRQRSTMQPGEEKVNLPQSPETKFLYPKNFLQAPLGIQLARCRVFYSPQARDSSTDQRALPPSHDGDGLHLVARDVDMAEVAKVEAKAQPFVQVQHEPERGPTVALPEIWQALLGSTVTQDNPLELPRLHLPPLQKGSQRCIFQQIEEREFFGGGNPPTSKIAKKFGMVVKKCQPPNRQFDPTWNQASMGKPPKSVSSKTARPKSAASRNHPQRLRKDRSHKKGGHGRHLPSPPLVSHFETGRGGGQNGGSSPIVGK